MRVRSGPGRSPELVPIPPERISPSPFKPSLVDVPPPKVVR